MKLPRKKIDSQLTGADAWTRSDALQRFVYQLALVALDGTPAAPPNR